MEMLLPEGAEIRKRMFRPGAMDKPVLAISDAHLKNQRTPAQRETFRKLCRLCEWAIGNEMMIIFVGDTADISAGYTPLGVKMAHASLFDLLDGYEQVFYCRGNHDVGIGPDWDSEPQRSSPLTLFKHGHDYFLFNYGLFGWLVGKPIVRIREWLKIPHKTSGWKKWFLQHTYFSNKAIMKRGPKDARAEGCSVIVTGHTHQPLLEIVDGILVANCGTVMNGDFVILTTEEVALCSDVSMS